MVANEELEQVFSQHPEIQYSNVNGDGYHYEITIVSDSFEGKRNVARQQWVYAIINNWIASGSLHAVTMKTYTSKEWEEQNG